MSLRKKKGNSFLVLTLLKACLPNTEQYIFQNTIPDIEFGMDLRSDTKHHSVSLYFSHTHFSGLESQRSVRMKVLHVERYHLPSKIIHNVKWGERLVMRNEKGGLIQKLRFSDFFSSSKRSVKEAPFFSMKLFSDKSGDDKNLLQNEARTLNCRVLLFCYLWWRLMP